MIATVQFVEDTFRHFNQLCFEGKLPLPPVVLVKARTFLGKMMYKQTRGAFGKLGPCYDYRMRISVSYDLTQSELEDVIIHEMIHYYIAYSNLHDSSAHGGFFRAMMNQINSQFGRHITIRRKCQGSSDSMPQTGIRKRQQHFFCISTFRDGRLGITVFALSKVFYMYRKLPRYYDTTKMQWYMSKDPFFEKFPRSITPKIYKITPDELAQHMSGVQKFECNGRVFKPVQE